MKITKKEGALKIIKNNKNNKIVENKIEIVENNINEEYQYDPDPKFTEDELKLIYADEDDNYFNLTEVVGTRKSVWNRLMIFPYYTWIEEYYGSKVHENVRLRAKIKEIKNKVKENKKKSKETRINEKKQLKF